MLEKFLLIKASFFLPPGRVLKSPSHYQVGEKQIYGGIHFRDGVEEGTFQGERIGDWVWNNTKGSGE